MHGSRHILFFVASLYMMMTTHGQVQDDRRLSAEELLYRDESTDVPFERLESEADLLSNPIQLNIASAAQLVESGLFTPFQAYQLLQYRERFGELLSVYELAGITGFRISRLMEIEKYLSVLGVTGQIYHSRGRDLIMLNAGVSLPRSFGYQDGPTGGSVPVYHASPLKTSIRIKSSQTRPIAIGLAFEKDAGERFIYGYRPEFISGYMQYQGTRTIRKIVVGNYRLQHGLGLVNGSGFMHTPAGIGKSRSPMSELRSYASLNEYLFRRGIATQLTFGQIGTMMWCSHQYMDLSTGSLPESLMRVDWAKYQRRSGLHRTANEIEGRYLAYRFNSGIQVSTTHKNFFLGTTIESEFNNLSKKGLDSLQAEDARFKYRAITIHWHWRNGLLESFGEFASGHPDTWAMLTGIRYHFSEFFQGVMMLHHYGEKYRGMFPSSYAWSNNLQNQSGLTLHFHTEPGRLVEVDFEAALFQHLSARYNCMVPSSCSRYSLIAQNPGTPAFRWRIRLVKKRWQTTPPRDRWGLRHIRTNELTRIDTRFAYFSWIKVQWQSRLVLSIYEGQSEHTGDIGYAATQQASILFREKLKCNLQFVVFHVIEWENRIYLHEPGLYYEFSFPSYYGKGQKITLTLSRRMGEKLTLSGKLSMISYHDRDQIGSGHDAVPGDRKINLGLQLRLSL